MKNERLTFAELNEILRKAQRDATRLVKTGQSPCPSLEELTEYADGQSPRVGEIAYHILGCDKCREIDTNLTKERLTGLKFDGNSLFFGGEDVHPVGELFAAGRSQGKHWVQVRADKGGEVWLQVLENGSPESGMEIVILGDDEETTICTPLLDESGSVEIPQGETVVKIPTEIPLTIYADVTLSSA